MIIRGFPGDNPVVAFPMYEQEWGGDMAVSLIQLHVAKVSTERAVALVKLWHIKPIHPIMIKKGNLKAFGAEYNNRYYGIAVWGPRRNRDHQIVLERIALAPNAPDGTAAFLFMASFNLSVDPELVRAESREPMEAKVYESCGWEKLETKRNLERPQPLWVRNMG